MKNVALLSGSPAHSLGRQIYFPSPAAVPEYSIDGSRSPILRIFYTSAVAVALLLFSITYALQQPSLFGHQQTALAATADPSIQAHATVDQVTPYVPMLEVHIANNGLTLIRGAKVALISNDAITATSDWGNLTMSWIVHVDSTTRFFKRDGTLGTAISLHVGDYVTITGDLKGTVAQQEINARYVRKEN